MGDDIGGLTLLGTSTTFKHISSPDQYGEYTVNYPATNEHGPYTVLGPVLLPQIYGKDLNAIEVGSSGIISLSIYDSNVLAINSNLNSNNSTEDFNMITVEVQNDDDAINLRSGLSINKIVLDSLMVSENDVQNIISTSKLEGLQFDDKVALTQTLSVQDNVFFSSNLSVGGVVTFCNNAYIEGKTFKIPVGDNSERPEWDHWAENFDQNPNLNEDDAPTGSVFFNTEEKKFQGLHNDGIWRGLGGVIDTDSDTFIVAEVEPGEDTDTLYFHANDSNIARMVMNESNLSVNLDVQIQKTLSVGDSVFFEKSLSVGGDVQLEGDLSVKGTLDVHAPVQFANTLSCALPVYFANTLSVQQAVYLNGTLSVKEDAHLKGQLTVSQTLLVEKDSELLAKLSVHGDTQIDSDLNVGGITMLNDTLFLRSNLSVEEHANFKSFVQIGSTLSVTDGVTFASTLSVANSVVLSKDLSVGEAVIFSETLSVGKSTVLHSTLSVHDATTLSKTLSVGGSTTLFNTLSVGNDITVQPSKTLFVDNITTTDANSDLVITLGSDSTGKLRINGDLEVLGTLNQINTTIESIQVTDKTITLAVGQDDLAGSNQTVLQDSKQTNHKSGIQIEGRPYGVESEDSKLIGSFDSLSNIQVDNIYEKSLLWNMSQFAHGSTSDGMRFNGGLNTFETSHSTNLEQIQNESFWEMKGGGLRITSLFKNKYNLVDKVSYGFRISRNRQLQFVKYEWLTTPDEGNGIQVNYKNPNILQTLGVGFN